MPPAHHSARDAAGIALVVLVLVVADIATQFVTNTWIYRDGRFYVNVNMTIVDDGTLEQHRFASSWYDDDLGWNRDLDGAWSNVSVGRRGEYWPKHPYLLPVLATPLVFAFGLLGTLLFNTLMFGVIAYSAFLFARRYASAPACAAAVAAFLLGTGVTESTYNYSVDILLLACFAAALGAFALRRAVACGALLALAVAIKPTTLLYAPAVAALFLADRDTRGLGRALIGGSVVLAVYGALNAWMYGRPWWLGYNRVLTIVGGERRIEAYSDAFSYPLDQGLKRTWSGPFALRTRYVPLVLGVPGVARLLASHRTYALAAGATAAGAVLLFSKYIYEGDRFLFPALVLVWPAVAAGIDAIAAAMAGVLRRVGRIRWRLYSAAPRSLAIGPALIAILAALPAFVAAPSIEEALPSSPYVQAALRLADGASGLGDATQAGGVSAATMIVAALFATALGKTGLAVLHLTALGAVAYASSSILSCSRAVSPAVAAAAAVGVACVDPVRDAVVGNGPALIGAAAALLAIDLALRTRWVAAGIAGALAAWILEAPLVALVPLVLALPRGRSAMTRWSVGTAALVIAWIALHLALPQSAGASAAAARESLADAIALAAAHPSPSRALLPFLIVGPLGLLAMARRAPALAIGLAVLFVAIASRGGVTPLLVVVAVASSVPALAWLATVLAQIVADRRTAWRLALAIAGGLLVAGVVARVGEATAPFRIASDRELRYADVHLGRFPCDFLAWEHLSWECSHFDHGVFEEVGLVVSEGIRVGGRRVRMLNVPVGGSGQRRTVKWRHVEIGRVLRLAYAVPDLQRGGIHVDVRIDGAIADAFDVPRQPDRRIHSRRVDTRRWAGRRARLSIEVAPTPGHFGGGTVAIDGSFHD